MKTSKGLEKYVALLCLENGSKHHPVCIYTHRAYDTIFWWGYGIKLNLQPAVIRTYMATGAKAPKDRPPVRVAVEASAHREVGPGIACMVIQGKSCNHMCQICLYMFMFTPQIYDYIKDRHQNVNKPRFPAIRHLHIFCTGEILHSIP